MPTRTAFYRGSFVTISFGLVDAIARRNTGTVRLEFSARCAAAAAGRVDIDASDTGAFAAELEAVVAALKARLAVV